MRKFVVYDCETGGLDAKENSLLTVTFLILDAQLQHLDQLELKVKPEDGVFKVTSGALGVNGIDLAVHSAQAITYKEARPKILNFLSRHSDNGKNKLTPVGHNVSFDDGFIQAHILNKSEWEALVSYRKIDTAGVAEFLKICNVVPGSVKTSLGSLSTFFGVVEPGTHNATVDSRITGNLLKAMKNRVSRNQNS